MNEKITFVAYENHHHQSNPKTDTETKNQRLIEKNQHHSMDNTDNNNKEAVEVNNTRGCEMGKAMIALVCGSLVYYHCAYRNSSLLSLLSDFLIVLLCSLAILGLLFRQLSISVPVDPLEWQISQDTANTIIASFANTVGAAESVLRVAATGHDKRLFFKVVGFLYLLSVLGRFVSGVTVAYTALWLFCLSMLADNTQSGSTVISWILGRNNGGALVFVVLYIVKSAIVFDAVGRVKEEESGMYYEKKRQ